MKLNVSIFKPSGKWYTDETIKIPNDIPDYDIPGYIINHEARIKNMTYLFNGPKYDVPHLVYVGE